MQIIEAPRAKRALEHQQLNVRLPKEFPWKLLQSVCTDLVHMHNVDASRLMTAKTRQLIIDLESAIRTRDVKQLLSCAASMSPRRMLDSGDIEYDEFFILYQLGALLKKYPFPGADTATPALSTFLKFEKSSALFNSENYKALCAMSDRHPDFLGIIEEIRTDILHCIGAFPNVQKVFDHAQHGPGTAIGQNSREGEVTSYYSWLPPYTVSPLCLPYAKQVIASDPRWIGALLNSYRIKNDIPQHFPISMDKFWDAIFEVTDYCKYASVPKTAETDRSIAIEPALNVFLQLGADRIIRSRLKTRWHYDLNSQELNQELAFDGSVHDSYCTIDLKGASETVTLKLCELYLPEGWYDLLTDLRSRNVMIDGHVMPLHKMSAMGNGFTFALESLIFASLVRCAMRRTNSFGRTAVYGDDLVVPKTAVNYLYQLLSLSGFTINKEKSFTDGPFRESCGKDYYLGHLVRPFFLKKVPKTIDHIFYIHNSLWNVSEYVPWAWDVSFKHTIRWLQKFIPPGLRDVSGPPSESLDTYLFSKNRLCRVDMHCYSHPVLLVRARSFNARTDFFFRKLMVSLKPTVPKSKWEEILATNTGSAFDVTKRGRTKGYLSVRLVWR